MAGSRWIVMLYVMDGIRWVECDVFRTASSALYCYLILGIILRFSACIKNYIYIT